MANDQGLTTQLRGSWDSSWDSVCSTSPALCPMPSVHPGITRGPLSWAGHLEMLSSFLGALHISQVVLRCPQLPPPRAVNCRRLGPTPRASDSAGLGGA